MISGLRASTTLAFATSIEATMRAHERGWHTPMHVLRTEVSTMQRAVTRS